MTGVRFHRLRHGRWVAAEGLIYEDYDPAVHLVDRFAIPSARRSPSLFVRGRAFDLSVVVLVAFSPIGPGLCGRSLHSIAEASPMVLTGREPGPAQIIEDARLAHQRGSKIFVARLSMDLAKASKGASLPLIADMIETIEAQGWLLDKMANAVFGRGLDYENITCLFRRTG